MKAKKRFFGGRIGFRHIYASDSSMKYVKGAIDNYQFVDVAQINSLLALGDVMLSGTFNFSAGDSISGQNSLYGIGKDKTILNMNALNETNPLISIGGTKVQLGGDFSAGNNCVAAAVKGADRIQILTAGLIDTINVGDVLMMASNFLLNNLRGQYYTAEIVKVVSKSGNFAILEKPLRYDYIVDAPNSIFTRLYKYNQRQNINLEGFRVNLGSYAYTGNQQSAISLNYVNNGRISEVLLDANAAVQKCPVGVKINECVGVRSLNNQTDNVQNISVSNQTGYGIQIFGGDDNLISRHVSNNCKHGIDVEKSNWVSVSYNTKISDCEWGYQGATGSNNRWLSLHLADTTEIVRCNQKTTASDNNTGLHNGMLLRGFNTYVHHCKIENVVSGNYSANLIENGEDNAPSQGGTGVNGGGIAGTGLRIEDCEFIISRIGGTNIDNANQGRFINIRNDAKNVSIKRNKFVGKLVNPCIDIVGNENDNISIEDNYFESAGNVLVNIAPQQIGSPNATNVSFLNNTKVGTYLSPSVQGALDIPTYTES